MLFKISIYLLSKVFLFNVIILGVKYHSEISEPLVGPYVIYGALLLVNRDDFGI